MPLPKVENKKPAKSSASGIPSMAMSTTRSGKILSDYWAVSGKKPKPSDSSREATESPSNSPNDTHRIPEPEAQNPLTTGAQASPPSQEGDASAPSLDETASSDGALNDLSPSGNASVTAPLATNNVQGSVPRPVAQAPSPLQGEDVSAPSLEEVTVSEGATKDESTLSVESSVMALLESDDNQVPAPVFDIELEPSPEILESEQNHDLSLEPSPTQNPTSNDSLANFLSTQALLLAPKLPNPNFRPSPPTDISVSPKPSQNVNPTTSRPTTPTSIGSPSVPSSIQHFNMLAASAQSPTRRNSMSSQYSKIEDFMVRLDQKFEDFKTDNHNTTQTLAGHATTLTSHGNTLTSILTAQEKQQQDLILLQKQNTTLSQDLAQQKNKITQLEKTVEDLKKSTEDLTANNVDLQNALKDIDDLKNQITTQNDTINALNTEQTANSAEAIQEQVQTHIDVLNTQQYWQRELDKSANQLVFKNLEKTPHTQNLHPRQIL